MSGPVHSACRLLLSPIVLGPPVLVVIAQMPMTCDLERGRARVAEVQAVRLGADVETFRVDCGRLPDSLDELAGVVREPDCVKSARRLSSLIDPYGEPFVYWRAADGGRFEIRSLGRDHVYGSADDVASDDWTWPWPRPWYVRVDGWRLMSVLLLPLLLAVAIGFRVIKVLVGALRTAWRRWHEPPRRRGNA